MTQPTVRSRRREVPAALGGVLGVVLLAAAFVFGQGRQRHQAPVPGRFDVLHVSESAMSTPRPVLVPPGRSCGRGLACGEGVSCCDSRIVPGGTFFMGRDDEGPDRCPAGMTCLSDETPRQRLTIHTFALDTFEVTVGRFRHFLAAYDAWIKAGNPRPGDGAGPTHRGWLPGWQGLLMSDARTVALFAWGGTWTHSLHFAFDELMNDTFGHALLGEPPYGFDVMVGRVDLPITWIPWHTAMAFCMWDGGRLPTEAEWEYAAAGGDQERPYPWGFEPPDASRANFGIACRPHPKHAESCSNEQPVGLTPQGVGRFGQFDLAGNAAEWTYDWYGDGGLQPKPTCVGAPPCGSIRGGSATSDSTDLRAAKRHHWVPNLPKAPQIPGELYYSDEYARIHGPGFRCARELASKP